jgi:Secretion system C-terminal sorting domain
MIPKLILVLALFVQLLAQNAALDGTTQFAWNEKRYNQIALNWLAGTAPDAADLRLIAQTCLNIGGRAVLGARGLCETWLKEYYDETNCNGSLQPRSENGAAPTAETSQMLRIIPNPADDLVRIYMNMPMAKGETLQVQFLTLSGQEVHTATLTPENGELAVPVQDWNDGVYVARIIRGSETFSQTFIVQHR